MKEKFIRDMDSRKDINSSEAD